MTTKELINQYVTAHADNRWMDASELEALLTEFAEELMKDAIDAQVSYLANERTGMKHLRAELPMGTELDFGEKVKVIIIKE